MLNQTGETVTNIVGACLSVASQSGIRISLYTAWMTCLDPSSWMTTNPTPSNWDTWYEAVLWATSRALAISPTGMGDSDTMLSIAALVGEAKADPISEIVGAFIAGDSFYYTGDIDTFRLL